jgi:Zn-dependent protease
MNATGAGTGAARRHPARGLPLGRIGGVPIVVGPSWVLSVAVIAALGVPVISQVVPGTSTGLAVAVSVVLGVALGASVLAHELGHCLAARRLGMSVVGVRLYLLGGVSELARVPRSPSEEAIIASAGPAVSAAIAGGCALLLTATTHGTLGWLLVLLLALSNLVVAVFNLLPALPLDGGRVLRAGVWRVSGSRRAGTTAAVIGGYVIAVLLAGWAVLLVADAGSAGMLPAGIAVAMALFVGVGAAAEKVPRRSVEWPVAVSLGSLARPVHLLPSETPVGTALQAAAQRDVLVIETDGTVRGLLDAPAALALAGRDPRAPALLVAVRFPPDAIVLPGDDPTQVAQRARDGTFAALLLIDDDGRPAGVLRPEDILAVLNRRPHDRKGPV